MESVALSTYTIRVLAKESSKPLQLARLGRGLDFLNILKEYLTERRDNIYNDDQQQMLISVERFKVENRRISGILSKGNYGYTSSLLNIDTRQVSHLRQEIEAEMMPFYFIFAVPSDADEGVAAIQKTSNIGVKLILEYEFKDFIRNHYPEFRIEMNSLVPEELLDRYLGQGRVTQIRLIKFGIPRDITDAVNLGHEEHQGTTELIIKAERGKSLKVTDRVRQSIEQELDVKKFIELKSFNYDKVKVQFLVNGKYRTVDLLDPENLRGDYDICGQIEMAGGHPIFDSIDRAGNEIIKAILKGMNLGDKDV